MLTHKRQRKIRSALTSSSFLGAFLYCAFPLGPSQRNSKQQWALSFRVSLYPALIFSRSMGQFTLQHPSDTSSRKRQRKRKSLSFAPGYRNVQQPISTVVSQGKPVRGMRFKLPQAEQQRNNCKPKITILPSPFHPLRYPVHSATTASAALLLDKG